MTEMTEWRVVSPATSGERGKVEATRVYSMHPGDVEVYQEGDLHSPRREGETRLIRIEGRNLDGVPGATTTRPDQRIVRQPVGATCGGGGRGR